MSSTLNDLSTYLKLFNLDSRTISKILNRADVVSYCLLRDKLTYAELLELQIIFKDIYYSQESKRVNLSKYIELTKSEMNKLSNIFKLKKNTLLEIASIIQMTPQELAMNIVNND
jgi:hypothetical protein